MPLRFLFFIIILSDFFQSNGSWVPFFLDSFSKEIYRFYQVQGDFFTSKKPDNILLSDSFALLINFFTLAQKYNQCTFVPIFRPNRFRADESGNRYISHLPFQG